MNKILFLHTSNVIGGAEFSLIDLLHNLCNNRFILHLVFSARNSFDLQRRLPEVICHPVFLAYPQRKNSLREGGALLYAMLKGAFQIYCLVKKEEFSTVYCNTYRSLPYCLFVKFFTSARIICHCRDRVQRQMIRIWLGWVADEVIAVSAYIAMQLPKRVDLKHVVYNGVDLSQFVRMGKADWLKHTYNLDRSVCCVGSIGQIVPWKNQLDFLQVARRLVVMQANVHFFILGEAVDKTYSRHLERLVEEWELKTVVTFAGHVEKAEWYMAGFDVMVHTAQGEPFGRVLVEAAAMEIPVIAYASGGPIEVIENEKTGYLVVPGNVEEIVSKILDLMNSSVLRRAIGVAARTSVAKRFGADSYAARIQQILTP